MQVPTAINSADHGTITFRIFPTQSGYGGTEVDLDGDGTNDAVNLIQNFDHPREYEHQLRADAPFFPEALEENQQINGNSFTYDNDCGDAIPSNSGCIDNQGIFPFAQPLNVQNNGTLRTRFFDSFGAAFYWPSFIPYDSTSFFTNLTSVSLAAIYAGPPSDGSGNNTPNSPPVSITTYMPPGGWVPAGPNNTFTTPIVFGGADFTAESGPILTSQ